MKARMIAILMILLIAGTAQAVQVWVKGNVSYFYPQDSMFQDIYKAGIRFGGDVEINFFKGLGVWIGADYFSKKGKLTYTEEETKLRIIPIYFGIKYRFMQGNVSPYLGVGVGFFTFKEENVIGTVDESDIGFAVQLGSSFLVGGPMFFDIQFGYTYCQTQPAEEKANLGGFQGSVGLGARF